MRQTAQHPVVPDHARPAHVHALTDARHGVQQHVLRYRLCAPRKGQQAGQADGGLEGKIERSKWREETHVQETPEKEGAGNGCPNPQGTRTAGARRGGLQQGGSQAWCPGHDTP